MTSRVRKSIWKPPECRRKRHVSGEKRDPKTIIPEGEKGVGGLIIVFMEIQAVIRFGGEV